MMCRFCNCGPMKVCSFCNSPHFRAEEKRILDSVMGPSVYDSRIRPAGINGTGEGEDENQGQGYDDSCGVLVTRVSVFVIYYECDCSAGCNVTSCF